MKQALLRRWMRFWVWRAKRDLWLVDLCRRRPSLGSLWAQIEVQLWVCALQAAVLLPAAAVWVGLARIHRLLPMFTLFPLGILGEVVLAAYWAPWFFRWMNCFLVVRSPTQWSQSARNERETRFRTGLSDCEARAGARLQRLQGRLGRLTEAGSRL